ncbi:MAG TPA: branched-chain amino acid ABC transporter permease [Mycobacteriales bacterium]|nr:branched-chain amino acid ABC transporter permease [Mycobacteriales bacterium]
MTAVAPSRGLPTLGRSEIRRLLGGVAIGLLIALITGPSGSGDDPYRGFQGSLLEPRVIPYVIFGLLFGAVLIAVDRGLFKNRMPATLTSNVGTPIASVRRLFRDNRAVRYGALALALAVAIYYPTTLAPFWQGVLVEQIGIFVLLALGLNIVVGLAGLLDLGFIAFFAIGAYTTAYFTGSLPVQPPVVLNALLVIPIAIVVAMIAGVILGGPTLRLRGDYLAIVTLGFGEIVRILAVNGDNFFGVNVTDGPRGASIPSLSIDLGPLEYEFGLKTLPYYYLVLAFTILVVIGFRNLEHSRVGRAWTAIREDEVAAAATGVPTVRYKLLAFSIGAATSGLGGVLYASKVGFFAPDNFLLIQSILVLTMVIFGGMGSIAGVILGAALLQWLPQVLRDYVPQEDRFIYFGALLVVMMIFRPQGLLPSRRRAREIRMAEAGIGGADGTGPTPGTTQ